MPAPTTPRYLATCPCCGTPTIDAKPHCSSNPRCTWRRCARCPAVFTPVQVDGSTWHSHPGNTAKAHGGTTLRCTIKAPK